MLPFVALSRADRRKLVTTHSGHTPLDRAIDLAERGASLIQVELPPTPTDDRDEELAELICALISTLFARDAHIVDDDGVVVPLHPSMIGVVCTHVSQVSAVVERLPRDSGILVETADRFQGLERALMIVHHPLSGRVECDPFHLDTGRFCVMLSRHRIACFLVTRGGIEQTLQQQVPQGNRIFGIDEDQEYLSWKAHLQVQHALRKRSIQI